MTAAGPSGLFLHASAAAVGGRAALFLGHSTSGKSTIVRLLEPRCPKLADDSVHAARGADGVWRVVDGGFRLGSGRGVADWMEEVRRRAADGAAAVPLGGCFRLHKAAEVRVELLEPVELARHLMDAAMEIDLQRKFGRIAGGAKPEPDFQEQVVAMRRQWFAQVAQIARTCPGWHLFFTRDADPDQLASVLEKTGRFS